MNDNLSILLEGIDEDSVQNLTRELCQTISQETNFNASVGKTETQVGDKAAEVITIGQIVLAIFGAGGGAVALINVFKSFVDRSKELTIKMKKNGDEIEITSKNVNTDEIKLMIENFINEKKS